MLTTAALAPRSGRRAGAAGVDGTRSRPWATDTVSPNGAQPQRGSARVPRGPAIPAARARLARRGALAGAQHDFEDGTLAMRVPVGLKLSVFSLAVMGVYTYFANSIPQIESKPPEELSLEGGTVTPAQLVKAGEQIFHTKGTCEVCHKIGEKGTRAPDLAGVGARAAKRKPGQSAKQYLIESLLDPGAYLVEGYPNIMPRVDKPPIGLNRSELWAVVALLESLGGSVDVKLDDIPKTAGAPAVGGTAAELKLPGDPKAGEAVFAGKGACIACHKAGKVGAARVGPDLSQIARIQTPEYIMGKILNPSAMGTVAGYPKGVMPPIFGQTLTAKEYVYLVSFLLILKCRRHERPALALRPGRRHPRWRLPGAALWHPSAGALERDPDLHGGGVPGGAHLRLLRHGLVALLREPDARRTGRPEPAASAHRARGRAADPARLLRLHAGGGQAAGARRAARGASGAAGLDPVPGQGNQHRGRRQPAPQGRGDPHIARYGATP